MATELILMAKTPGTAARSSSGCAGVHKAKSLADNKWRLKSRFTSFGASKIHYATTGEGMNTIVFVHCWAGNLGFWREQAPALANKARLVLIDLPGHGQSSGPHIGHSMYYFASAILSVMQDAQVDKATFIGHSMGGPVIYRVYEQAPEKVAALVAVD